MPNLFFVLVLAVVAAGILTTQGQKTRLVREQTYFSEDEPFQSPVALPPDVLKVLLATDQAKQALEFAKPAEQNNPARLFRAAEVHLHNSDETDLIIMGISPMSGADNTWFWVVRSARKDPKVVLFAGGNSLKVLVSRTSDFRDIWSGWASAAETSTRVYKFDGKEYKLWKEKTTENRY